MPNQSLFFPPCIKSRSSPLASIIPTIAFPMEEIPKPKNLQKTLNFKMSNMNMNIVIKIMKISSNISDSSWIKETKFNHYTFPTFTKKIFNSLENYL